jgi:hypothetical protein
MSEGSGVGVDMKEHLMAAVHRLDGQRATEFAPSERGRAADSAAPVDRSAQELAPDAP